MLAIAGLAVLLGGSGLSAAQSADTATSAPAAEPVPSDMGPVCWAAILESMSSYGAHCLPDEHTAFKAALEDSIRRFDARFLAAGWSAERLAAFKRQMREEDRPVAQFCASRDALQMYRHLEKSAAEIGKATEAMVARPGAPEWGTCL